VSDLRVGIGVDAHRLAEGVPLVLAGVSFPGEPGLVGHSDGDVIAHALIDAVLGAANLGDIGTLFPASPQWSGAVSLELLASAYAQVREAGWRLVNADCVLIGERPRIADRRDELARSLASALAEVDSRQIAVRATTTDGLGFTGRGEGLAAQAVALLERS
jgi:2-C-methyl-D-erythritol 2,4-cyclodiphosphate synthase